MSLARVKALKKFVEEMFKKEQEDRNPNRPRKGDVIRVEPIRKPEDIQAIKNLLRDEPRNLAVFVMGINSALRGSDLLRILEYPAFWPAGWLTIKRVYKEENF